MNSQTLPPSFASLSAILSDQNLTFPGLDAAVLQAHDAEVAAAEQEVRRAEQALADARDRLRACEIAALEKGERALSYLRVFAADNDAVAAAISGVALTRTVAKVLAADAPRRGRGRPRKEESALPFEAGASEARVADAVSATL